jgi:hypothetical protein
MSGPYISVVKLYIINGCVVMVSIDALGCCPFIDQFLVNRWSASGVSSEASRSASIPIGSGVYGMFNLSNPCGT